MVERILVKEYYENPQQFVDEVMSINVRKLEKQSDKDLIKKLKRWIKEYWGNDGENYHLYESQYARLQILLKEKID